MNKAAVVQLAKTSSFLPPAQGVIQRKCACGNHTMAGGQCAECAKKKNGLQRKLSIGASNDPLEREADRVADQVLATPTHNTVSRAPPRIQRYSGQPNGQMDAAPASVDQVMASPGRPLEPALRQDMEQRFGYDFSRVRVHSNDAAERSARDVNAHAYTVDQHIIFGAGRFAPQTRDGRRLIAHELTHVIQQSATGDASNRIMRKGFESTVDVCHRVLESRKFQVSNGGVRVVLLLKDLDKNVPNCRDFNFGVTLTRSEDWWPDDEIGTCEATTGGTRSFSFANIPNGEYYLTFWRTFDHPYCCLEGDVMVFDEAITSDSAGCQRDKDLSAMDIVHGALDIAGFIPVLGAIPDGINAAIYVVEGDWANAGLSAVAMVPVWGDGVKLGAMGSKSVIKISEKAAFRLGEEGIAKGLKEVKAVSKVEKAAEDATKTAKQLEKEAAEKATGKAEREAAEKKKKEKKQETKEGLKPEEPKGGKKRGRWGCTDVRCNVYPNQQADPPNPSCPKRVIGNTAYIYPSYAAACLAAQQDANSKVPRGCIKRHCNCKTKCTQR